MNNIILFMEGIITFVSPCILPMLPIYISYFMGGNTGGQRGKALFNSIGFVIGFTAIFTMLGATAGTLGIFLNKYINIFNIIGGLILIILGLNYTGVLRIGFLEKTIKLKNKEDLNNLNLLSSIIFGMIFAIGWTPCVGTFLGSALMLAANSSSSVQGVIMLLVYSLGLGIPFILSALLIDSLKEAFNFIKRNYRIINIVSGLLLIVLGVMMMTGYLNVALSFLTF